MFPCSVLLLALFASAQGRAVNISNTWVLPEEGFPVFYRYFRDRISWYEADAVCQFHHANLVTVDTTAQYDAVRAYLKELDISSAVWVGLIRSNPDGDFTWTDYRGLSGDGYWSAAPDARAAPLCASADPAADYRWEARACGGPTVASFICELPVPQWALGNEGCMVKALPALTILYLPESAAVQLTADCGLAGVKRVQCTGNVKRDNLLKDLSCNEDDEVTTMSGIVTDGSSTYGIDLASNASDLEIANEVTTEVDVTTKYTSFPSNFGTTTQATPVPVIIKGNLFNKKKITGNNLNNENGQKNINLDLIHNNNLQSNEIPKLANNDNFLTIEESEKLEDEKNMHHKMLHDELARHGNFETIFTLPTDHFVPPLVMAKAKISDDMTVLSLAEKHAQQIAEHQRFGKINGLLDDKYIKIASKYTTEEPHEIEINDKPLVLTIKPSNEKESLKKDKVKSALPKKYKDKYDDPKGKNLKIDGKILKSDKFTEKYTTPHDKTTVQPEISATQVTNSNVSINEDDLLKLTVVLKDVETKSMEKKYDVTTKSPEISKVVYTESVTTTAAQNTVSNIATTEVILPETTKYIEKKYTSTNKPEILKSDEITTTFKPTTELPIKKDAILQDLAMNHDVIKITIVDDDDKINLTHTVFEVATLVPVFKDVSQQAVGVKKSMTNKDDTTTFFPIGTTQKVSVTITETTIKPITTQNETTTHFSENVQTVNTPLPSTSEGNTRVSMTLHENKSTDESHLSKPFPTAEIPNTTEKQNTEILNITEMFEIDSERNFTDPDAIDDLNSPLLSAANEPIHRPNRSRRPQQPTKKFNPFRILG